ncbi:MAG: methyltransferase [Planctomycetota bacterium]
MLGFGDEADYRRARDLLVQADYTEQGIGDRLGRRHILAVPAVDVPPWLRRTSDLSPLDAFIRLFLLGVPVPASAVRQALAPMSLDTWVAAELLALEDRETQVAPRIKLLPVGHLVVGADRPQRRADDARPDYVMPPAVTTLELAHATIRSPCRRTLDLGTGSGVLGLLAASHSEEVIATDSNPRAVAFSRFNARLNGIDNVSCRTGSLFEPVAEERFDLIVSNPPFVLSPTRRFLFRDAEIRGDEFCRRLIRSVPTFLEEGGYCQLKCNFAHRPGEGWKESLTSWFEGLRCDVIVWVEITEDVSNYAMRWIVSTESQDVDQLPDLYQQWMDYYRAQKIEAVSYLLITLRRRDQRHNWTHIDGTPRRIAGPCSAELLRTLALRDTCGPLDDDGVLLGKRLRLAADVHIQQRRAMTSEGLQVAETQLEKTGGSQFAMGVEPKVAGFVARCDGTRSVREILAEMEGALGADDEFVKGNGIGIIRLLMDRGMLLPEEIWGDSA